MKTLVEVISTCAAMRSIVKQIQHAGQSVGFVPTMGALHEGHASLISASARQCDATVVSIFVNPTQFGPGEDLDQYPRTLEDDLQMIQTAGGTHAFVPSVDEMYPDGFSTSVTAPAISQTLEGEHRPGHFSGVTTVVAKLFGAVPADRAFFGRKDYQQLKVIQTMVRDLNIGIKIVGEETVRENDGLALSSRNRYLSAADRHRALSLSRALQAAGDLVAAGQTSIKVIESTMINELAPMDQVDYARVVDAQTLRPIATVNRPVVALIAARVGGTRLIDNRVLTP